ncbi:putative ABC transport system ATP-binding protein [Actinopolyspora mzabensis]|uniref:Putative ABC transport system ATP-binding protein n=1 Tax=Actinopolyspora mzabensis TaxID=995066 RepID=A0A1G9C1P9_ACTMZ|nr:ABC transporter ATP-binding protein [Actinopolyspora mzabensis]SDK45607.1 putative ABC transport system ATP-binding protein [Actinopolyspora mzabensis]
MSFPNGSQQPAAAPSEQGGGNGQHGFAGQLAESEPAPATSGSALVKVYGSGEAGVRALDNVDIGFAGGRFSAIMGPSGSGKSTLMHCLAGLDTPTSGRVMLGETDLTGLSDKQLTLTRRDRIGFLFQSFNLLPTLTAEQNILLPLELSGRKPDRQWLNELTESLGIDQRLRHRPSELSGGQQQRVAVARALVTRPEVVFADEPTGALDSKSGANLLEFLRGSVRQFGQTVVMVTHDPVAASHADSVVLLADGNIAGRIEEPTQEAVLDSLRRLGG